MSPRIVIIGNGITGITAARHVRKYSDAAVTVVSAESPHFISRPALMYAYMGHIREDDLKPYADDFWEKNRISLRQEFAERIDTDGHTVHLAGGERLGYDRLVIATGSTPNRFGWPGQYLDGVQGFYSIQDLRLLEENTRGLTRGVVVGGGLIGVEVAEMLASRGIPVTFLVRETGYMDYLLPPEESHLVEQQIRAHGIDLRLGTELGSIEDARTGDGDAGPGENQAGRVTHIVTSSGERFETGFVALTAGVSPNTLLARKSGIETAKGVLVTRRFETSATDVFAAGDCAEFRDPLSDGRTIEQLWYTGRLQGEVLARILCGEEVAYDQPVFFNSAKFFDLEYQTYGRIDSVPEPGMDSIVATEAAEPSEILTKGRTGRLIRIQFERASRRVVGFNLLGVRFRHETCARWIETQQTVDTVVARLSEASFDPEFSRSLIPRLQLEFRERAGRISTMTH